MRHRSQIETPIQAPAQEPTTPGRLLTLSELMATDAPIHGKHRAPAESPMIPAQKLRSDRETSTVTQTSIQASMPAPVEAPTQHLVKPLPRPLPKPAARPVTQPVSIPAQAQAPAPAVARPIDRPTPAPAAKRAVEVAPVEIPHDAHWRASHTPRLVASGLLVLAAAGTAGLGVRYEASRASDDLLSLVIGAAVVVVLWALVIASTPQTVTLSGSILTVRTTGGAENFDLADGLQPVDVVGDPRTSHWAVLLHRPNATTMVLRRNDIDPVEFDPIVRHYRNVATQRFLEREARFNL